MRSSEFFQATRLPVRIAPSWAILTGQMPTRRDLLKTLAVVSAAPALAQRAAQQAPVQESVERWFTPPQFELLTRLADMIIPRSDTPGAADAGVPAIIESAVRRREPLQERFRLGLADVDAAAKSKHGHAFTELAESEQIALLQAMSEDRFFKLLKDMTVEAYYSTEEGLRTELGWNANTYLDEFQGCTHPEHQAPDANKSRS